MAVLTCFLSTYNQRTPESIIIYLTLVPGPKPNLVSNPALTQFVIVMEVSQMLELYPDYSISVTLFSEVSNITELREMLIQGKLTAAFVNATMVPDVLAVLLACNKAVHLSVCGKLKTRSVYSEVVFNLSPTRDITESLKTFGLSDEYPTVLVVVINKNGTNNMANVVPLIKGQQVALTELQSIMDEHKIKKVYKIPDIELSCGSLTDAVVTRIATKDASKR